MVWLPVTRPPLHLAHDPPTNHNPKEGSHHTTNTNPRTHQGAGQSGESDGGESGSAADSPRFRRAASAANSVRRPVSQLV